MNAIITRTGPVLPLELYPANFTSSAPKLVALISLSMWGIEVLTFVSDHLVHIHAMKRILYLLFLGMALLSSCRSSSTKQTTETESFHLEYR